MVSKKDRAGKTGYHKNAQRGDRESDEGRARERGGRGERYRGGEIGRK